MHTAQLMPLPRTVSCFSKIQIGFAFLVPAHLGSPGKGAVKRVCVCVCVCVCCSVSAVHVRLRERQHLRHAAEFGEQRGLDTTDWARVTAGHWTVGRTVRQLLHADGLVYDVRARIPSHVSRRLSVHARAHFRNLVLLAAARSDSGCTDSSFFLVVVVHRNDHICK